MVKIEYNGIVPVYVNDGGSWPEEQMYYLISGSGIFLVRETMIGPVVTQVKGIDGLIAMQEGFLFDIPKIPRVMFEQITAFFRDVYEKHKSEAIVLLYFNNEGQGYHIEVPKQQVSGASVRYEAKALPGHRFVGTIHSHGSMGAFHSGVDDKDEEAHDGIHITIGNVNTPSASISCSVVFSGSRIKLEAVEIVEPFPAYPTTWLSQVEEHRSQAPTFINWKDRPLFQAATDQASKQDPWKKLEEQEKPAGKKKKKKNKQDKEEVDSFVLDLFTHTVDTVDDDDISLLSQYYPLFAEYLAENLVDPEVLSKANYLNVGDLFKRFRKRELEIEKEMEDHRPWIEQEICLL